MAGDCRTRLPLGCSLRVPISIAAISLIGKARLVALILASDLQRHPEQVAACYDHARPIRGAKAKAMVALMDRVP